MRGFRPASALLLLLAFLAPAASALAQGAGKGSGSLLPGANSKDPVSINAAKLDYFDKEQKLVYSGDVVAKQGDSTLRGSVLTVFLTKGAKAEGGEAAAGGGPAGAGSSVSRMEVTGPVTVVSKDQIGTGDNGTYDKAANRITLVGNVTLSQGTNIVKGDRLVYDMNSGQAQVTSGATAPRITSVFTPGSGTPDAVGGGKKKPAPKPAAAHKAGSGAPAAAAER